MNIHVGLGYPEFFKISIAILMVYGRLFESEFQTRQQGFITNLTTFYCSEYLAR